MVLPEGNEHDAIAVQKPVASIRTILLLLFVKTDRKRCGEKGYMPAAANNIAPRPTPVKVPMLKLALSIRWQRNLRRVAIRASYLQTSRVKFSNGGFVRLLLEDARVSYALVRAAKSRFSYRSRANNGGTKPRAVAPLT